MSEPINFISPIRLVGPMFNRCDFYVDQVGPTGGMLVDVSIDVPDDAALTHEAGAFVLHHVMKVLIRVREDEGDGSGDREVMHAAVSMAGAVSVSDEVGLPEGEILQALRVNAVSLFYSSVRSYIESMTSMSSMGRFTIPAIDPQAYVSSADQVGKRGSE